MKYYLIILGSALIGCNSDPRQEKQEQHSSVTNNCFIYPEIVDKLQVKDLFDSARWSVYSWHCDQAYLSKRDTNEMVTFGELPLRFNNLIQRRDTLEINFDFIDEHENEAILPSMTRNNKEFLSGVGFNLRTRRKIYMLSPNGFSTVIKGDVNRYENSLHPQVLEYIKIKWDKLNDCYRKLAEQKGVMK